MFIVKGTAPYDPGTGDFAHQLVADLVGWGTSNVFEDAAADVSTLSATTSLTRAPGAVDTDNNGDDFSTGAPNPNAQPTLPVKTIAEIQGTGPTTPLPNALVETSGVVTAAYPSGSGNLSGFYIQTPGPTPRMPPTAFSSSPPARVSARHRLSGTRSRSAGGSPSSVA